MAKEAGTGAGVGLCPFSWIEVTKPAGCLSSLFGGKEKPEDKIKKQQREMRS